MKFRCLLEADHGFFFAVGAGVAFIVEHAQVIEGFPVFIESAFGQPFHSFFVVQNNAAADVEKAGFVHGQYIAMVGGKKDPGEILVHRVPHIFSCFSLEQGHAAERVALFLSFFKELTALLFVSLPVTIAFPFYEA